MSLTQYVSSRMSNFVTGSTRKFFFFHPNFFFDIVHATNMCDMSLKQRGLKGVILSIFDSAVGGHASNLARFLAKIFLYNLLKRDQKVFLCSLGVGRIFFPTLLAPSKGVPKWVSKDWKHDIRYSGHTQIHCNSCDSWFCARNRSATLLGSCGSMGSAKMHLYGDKRPLSWPLYDSPKMPFFKLTPAAKQCSFVHLALISEHARASKHGMHRDKPLSVDMCRLCKVFYPL